MFTRITRNDDEILRCEKGTFDVARERESKVTQEQTKERICRTKQVLQILAS
jgi:hypothetical protein